MSLTIAAKMGWLRAMVGLLLIAAAGPLLRLSRRQPTTAASILLLRTIGIRDLVIGLGTVAATTSARGEDVRRWTTVALASDCLDVVASMASRRSIGPLNAVGATALAVVAVSGDVQAIRSIYRVQP